jgi:hypothetical protein
MVELEKRVRSALSSALAEAADKEGKVPAASPGSK